MFSKKKIPPEKDTAQELREQFVHDCANMFTHANKDNLTLKANFFDISAIIIYMRDYGLEKYKLPNDMIVRKSQSGESYHLSED